MLPGSVFNPLHLEVEAAQQSLQGSIGSVASGQDGNEVVGDQGNVSAVTRGTGSEITGLVVDRTTIRMQGLENSESPLEIPLHPEHGWFAATRRGIARALEPNRRVDVAVNSKSKLPVTLRRARERFIDWVDYSEDTAFVPVVRAVVNDHLQPDLQLDSEDGLEHATCEPGEQVILLQSHRSKTRRSKPDRVYRLTGRICDSIKCSLGEALQRTPENVALVRETARRRLETLRKKRDPDFDSLRDHDAQAIAAQAAVFYFIMDDHMEFMSRLCQDHGIRREIRRRDAEVARRGGGLPTN